MSQPLSENGAQRAKPATLDARVDPLRRWSDGSRELVSTPTFSIGRHILPTKHDEWGQERCLGTNPIVAFSTTPIEATFEGNWPAMLDRSTVATPPAGAGYKRVPVTEQGHVVSWISATPETMAEIVAHRDESARTNPNAPFSLATTPTDIIASAGMTWLSQMLFGSHSQIDPMQLDESAITILDRIAFRSAECLGKRTTQRGATRRKHREIANETCKLIATRFGEKLSISDLSSLLGLSPAYLSRVFRWNTGQSIHQHLICTRLLHAMDMLGSNRGSLAWVAARCGFASHAHLTSSCTTLLGSPPSGLDLKDARRNLTLLLTRKAG
ncbi:MAG: hypothetical protein Phyf2KO_06660 [Phycisphaerales bacterium]